MRLRADALSSFHHFVIAGVTVSVDLFGRGRVAQFMFSGRVVVYCGEKREVRVGSTRVSCSRDEAFVHRPQRSSVVLSAMQPLQERSGPFLGHHI